MKYLKILLLLQSLLMSDDLFDKTIGCFLNNDDREECSRLFADQRFENAIHESAHVLLFKPIVELDRPYSNFILSSIRVESRSEKHEGYTVVARVNASETPEAIDRLEVEMRMKMYISGDIAYRLITNIKKDGYLKVNSIAESDMYRWYAYARESLEMDIASSKALLKKQEPEVAEYINANIIILLKLARIYYNEGGIKNSEIIKIIAPS